MQMSMVDDFNNEDDKQISFYRREGWALFAPAALFTMIGFLLAWSFVGPPPPRNIKFASGSSWGAYYKYAQAYGEHLKPQGIKVEVQQTKGSTQNLDLLVRGEVDIAFVQGGVLPKSGAEKLRALGSVYLEPLWVFLPASAQVTEIPDLAGKKLAIGPEGSGTRAIALQVLNDNELLDKVELLPLGGGKAKEALLTGEADAAFLVGSHTIATIRDLLNDRSVRLLNFERARAYRQRHQFLTHVTLFQGVVDLAKGVPEQDVNLVAPAATLVVREEFHASLVPVVLQAAEEIHGRGGILEEDGQFPTPRFTTFPIDKSARYYYQHGVSYLYRHLDFHIANAIDRMTILLLPLLGLLFPLARLLPPVYWWTLRRRIYRQYHRIHDMENRAPTLSDEELEQELYEIDEAVNALKGMPPSWGSEVHTLKIHFDRARERVSRNRPLG